MRLIAFITTLFVCAVAAPFARGGEADPAAGMELFEKRIRPVLVDRCYECHSAGAKKVKGRLLLDSREAIARGGEGGPIVVAGAPDKSRLITALRFADAELQMPPKHQLTTDEIAAFEQWVKVGAPDPRVESGVAVKTIEAYDFNEAKKFWSFQPVREPATPVLHDDRWPVTSVDRLVAAGYEQYHLTPAPLADKRTLVRRATYDLTGLPPTPEEVDAFLADGSPDAFEKVVDRLLASNAYGERWGRHWLDLVRYADTSGCNSDFPVRDAYRYRNWVIDAFNRDLPYDRFLTEQLAGDLLPAKDAAEHNEKVIATGYLAIARRFGSRGNEFHLTIEDVIDNVGKSMLGLSVNCARCHDHKFDPIPASDYYALYGIFASTKFAFPGTEILRHSTDFTSLGDEAGTAALKAYERRMSELDERLELLQRERDTLLSREKATRRTASSSATQPSTGPTTQPATQPVLAAATQPAATQPHVRNSDVVIREMAEAKEEVKRLEAHPPTVDKAYAATEGTPHDVKIQRKGDPKDLGDLAPRGFLTVLGGQRLADGAHVSGRLQLAQWITDSANPLTARVMVNRIWQHHFGVGLVKTPNDFGARGQRPTDPALLDHLAGRFVASGWSVKAMHKLIMRSRAYQLASGDDAHNYDLDPNNDHYWRQNPQRLSAEEIRDTLLADAGTLDRSVGGPHPFPPETEWKYTQHRPFYGDYSTRGRAVYLMQQRIRKQPFLAVFDGSDPNAATSDRAISTTAIQALFMMNDPLLHEQADRLAQRVTGARPDDATRIDYAFQLCLNRPATGEETASALQYIANCSARLAGAGVSAEQRGRQALDSYLRVLLSSNEFVFVD